MTHQDLLRELQGDLSQEAFAEKLGTTQPTISRLYAGHIRPSRAMIAAMVRAFPERRQAILDCLFASEYADTDVPKRIRMTAS